MKWLHPGVQHHFALSHTPQQKWNSFSNHTLLLGLYEGNFVLKLLYSLPKTTPNEQKYKLQALTSLTR